jgi:hypothetical protein
MPDETKDFALDLSRISFPTDRITLGQLRREEPAVFTSSHLLEGHLTDIGALSTLHVEITLAEKAFAKAAGRPDPHRDDNRRELIRLLDHDYRAYGMSAGLRSTQELVRAFESLAAKQGRTHLPG